jgi:extracellular factor (EF) 3-hydroxypalmitic acid methyl ester biosynthesis protein
LVGETAEVIRIYVIALSLLRCFFCGEGEDKDSRLYRFKASRKGGLMSVQERRRKPRESDGLGGSSFIEIRHTFGPVRKSVYKVVEFNENGTSFLMPASDGFFRSGHPLEYSLITPDLAKVEGFGVVRYYHPYNDHTGNSYFKVGLEAGRSGSERKSESLRIRPPRLHLSQFRNEHAIYFFAGDKEYELSLVDISRYSAAFLCDEEEAFNLGISNVLTSVEITFGPKMVFEGSVVVTKRMPDGDKYRIVVEPRSAVFNIDAIEEQERITSVAGAVNSLLHVSLKDRFISSAYKAQIADIRVFLEGYREILDTPTASRLALESDRIAFLEELNKTFYPKFDEYWAHLDNLVTDLNLSDADHGVYKSYCQRHLHPLVMKAPFCHRIFFKPLGYPGDFEMMRMLRDNKYEGPTPFSMLLNKYALKIPLAEAARNRNQILAERIAEFVRNHPSQIVRILSMASGPALEIQQLIETYPEEASRIHVTLLDQEVEALRYSQDCIYMKRIIHNSNIKVELVHQNIGAFIRQISRPDKGLASFHMIYIFGLFDYFDDKICAYFIKHAAELLAEKGKMLISNFSLDRHHHRVYMEYMFDWYIVFRSKEKLEELGNSTKIPCIVRVDEDPTSVIKFLDIQSCKGE